jgi:FSR family fosmidomycin resistance protein-like MFS transporter
VKFFSQIAISRALLVLMLGHFANDLLSGILPVLFPVMKIEFRVTNAELGLITLVFTASSSLTQPLFGYFSDTHGRRWFIPLTLVWGATCVSLYGLAPSYNVVFLLAALAGIGSGAFHPLGASNAAAVSSGQHRNAALAWYTVAGSTGYGLGPLLAVALLAIFGPPGTLFLIVPGVIAAALIWPQMRVVERARQARTIAIEAARTAPQWRPLTRVILVTMLRSWVSLSVLQMSPIWYSELGFGRAFYGPLATIIIIAGAFGTLCGGGFADRIGQRRVVAGAIALTIPALTLYALFPGPQGLLLAALFGFISDASLSVTLVMAQRLMPGRVGVASGLILGLGFVTGGIGVPITGRIADLFGMQTALLSLTALLALGSLIALTLPSGTEIRQPAVPAEPVMRASTLAMPRGGRR